MTFRNTRLAGAGLIALFTACGIALAAAEKKPDPPKVSAPEPGVLAIVGDVKISETDLMTSMPPDRQKQFEGADLRLYDVERQALDVILAKRYVAEQIKAKGVTEEAFYAQEIGENRDGFDQQFKVQIAQMKQQIYDARRVALDDFIGAKLEEKAAKDKGITVDELIKTEVEVKVAPATQADIDQFYTQNQRMFGGQAKEAVTKQIEDQIHAQRVAQQRTLFRNSLRSAAQVRVFLEVPRIKVAVGDDPIEGSKDAPVVVVHFSDYQ